MNSREEFEKIKIGDTLYVPSNRENERYFKITRILKYEDSTNYGYFSFLALKDNLQVNEIQRWYASQDSYYPFEMTNVYLYKQKRKKILARDLL